jgi:hypothetical protein
MEVEADGDRVAVVVAHLVFDVRFFRLNILQPNVSIAVLAIEIRLRTVALPC